MQAFIDFCRQFFDPQFYIRVTRVGGSLPGHRLLSERVFIERPKYRPLLRKRPERTSVCIPAVSALLAWLAQKSHNDRLCAKDCGR